MLLIRSSLFVAGIRSRCLRILKLTACEGIGRVNLSLDSCREFADQLELVPPGGDVSVEL